MIIDIIVFNKVTVKRYLEAYAMLSDLRIMINLLIEKLEDSTATCSNPRDFLHSNHISNNEWHDSLSDDIVIAIRNLLIKE